MGNTFAQNAVKPSLHLMVYSCTLNFTLDNLAFIAKFAAKDTTATFHIKFTWISIEELSTSVIIVQNHSHRVRTGTTIHQHIQEYIGSSASGVVKDLMRK